MTELPLDVLPGVANVHSHAFQRRLRGRVQARNPAVRDSFWTWREAMYDEALTLSLSDVERTARALYVEMVESGYTAVGEFHYLHHQPDGTAYADPVATSRALLRAAADVGLRITLLFTVYARGGIDTPLSDRQRRFATPSIEAVWRAVDALQADVSPTVQIGLALHSVRAVPREWLGQLTAGARARSMVVHVHASEQPAEVAATREAYGLTPIALLDTEGALTDVTTIVHGTWATSDDIARLATRGSTVCLCPTTECDLGDGVPPTSALFRAGVPLCVGSDSHVVVDPFAELRLVEHLARAATNERCVVVDAHGQVAPALTQIAHRHGYRALGLDGTGDTIGLDLGHPTLASTNADLASVAWLSGHPGVIDRVTVAGHELVRNGRHVERAALIG